MTENNPASLEDELQKIREQLLSVGRSWARYGLHTGRSLLVTVASRLVKTGETLDEMASSIK